jgi:hypothetical protein
VNCGFRKATQSVNAFIVKSRCSGQKSDLPLPYSDGVLAEPAQPVPAIDQSRKKSMMTIGKSFGVGKYLGIICLGGMLASGAAFAQATAPAPTPAPAAKAAPAMKTAPAAKASSKERSAISKKCSADADAKKLHGKERKTFRSDCMKTGKAG